MVAGGAIAAQPPPTPPALKEVIVVHKTHFDIGYTALASEVVERYRTTMIDKALSVTDGSRTLPEEQRFVWTIPGWPMAQVLWGGQTSSRRERVLEALRAGRFTTHALPFTTHTESLDIEDLVRGLVFASRQSRALRMELPRDAKMTDVPSHSWILPTLLKHAGVDFLHLGANSMSSGPELPSFGVQEPSGDGRVIDKRHALFWWEGPDGSRILTMYSRRYGSDLAPPPDWPCSTWLAMIHSGDNAGPPTPESIQKLLADARVTLPGVRVRLGRLADFADALLKEHPKLPVVRGDMPDPWIHGVMSMPVETALIRHTRPQIGALEALNTLLGLWGGQEDAAATIEAAYEQSLLYGEHTWGYDAKRFPRPYGDEWQVDRAAGKFARLEQSWNEHREYSRRAAALTGPQFERNLQTLSAAVRVEGKRIAVFNSAPWVRGGVVETKFGGPAPQALRDAESGRLVPVELRDGMLRFVARDVPPLGYRTYAFSNQAPPAKSRLEADEKRGSIENEYFRITFDPEAGRIAAVFDKSARRELADSQADSGFAQYLHEQFSAADMERFVKTYTKGSGATNWGDFGKPNMPAAAERPHRSAHPQHMRFRLQRGPVSVAAVMESETPHSMPYATALTATLYEGQPYVNVGWRVTGKTAAPEPEGGWLAFAFNVAAPRYRLARLGAVIDPSMETVDGSNHDVHCLTGGVALLDANLAGVGLCPLDSPLVSLDHPGLWEYTRKFASTRPRVFVNLYNNLWGTNFAQWNEGSWSSQVKVWSIRRYAAFADLVRPSWEARTPLRGVVEEGAAGNAPVTKAGLRLSRPGVLVTAFGKNPDGAGRVLRLWEQSGESGPVRVCLPDALHSSTVQPADLRGRAAGKAIAVRAGCFATSLQRNAPASFLLE